MRGRWRILIVRSSGPANIWPPGGRDLSGSAGKRGRVSRFRKGDRSAVAREHDRVWQKSLAFVQRTLRFRLQDGDFPDGRFSGCDESERRILASPETERHTKGLGRRDADAAGALRFARLRS